MKAKRKVKSEPKPFTLSQGIYAHNEKIRFAIEVLKSMREPNPYNALTCEYVNIKIAEKIKELRKQKIK